MYKKMTLKTNFMKMIKVPKEKMNNSLKEIKEKNLDKKADEDTNIWRKRIKLLKTWNSSIEIETIEKTQTEGFLEIENQVSEQEPQTQASPTEHKRWKRVSR